jgi:hypothetical protein
MKKEYLLGCLAVSFYLAHSLTWWLKGAPANMWWACHLACLLIGISAFTSSARLNAIGVLWLVLGNILWTIYLLSTADFLPTSFLTHVGGLLIGLYLSKKMGFPRFSWFIALLAFAVLQVMTHWLSPAKENINLAFRVQDGWESYFDSYPAYILLLYACALACFTVSEFLIRKWLR